MLNKKWRKTTIKFASFAHLTSLANITISESATSSVLTVLFSAATSATMNLITDSQIICFYPELTMNGRSVGGYCKPTMADVIMHFLRGWNLIKTTEMYNRPCSIECPSNERRVRGLEGITLVGWRESTLEDDYLIHIEHTPFSWSTGYHCKNRECPFCILRQIERV